MIKIVENIFYTKIQSHKLLKTLFDVLFSAVSDETTLKLFYSADRTNCLICGDCRSSFFPKMVYSIKKKISNDKIVLIP